MWHMLCVSKLLHSVLSFAVDDGCLENTPDTAEFSREYQLHQHLFDPEHDYPNRGKWVSTCFLLIFVACENWVLSAVWGAMKP